MTLTILKPGKIERLPTKNTTIVSSFKIERLPTKNTTMVSKIDRLPTKNTTMVSKIERLSTMVSKIERLPTKNTTRVSKIERLSTMVSKIDRLSTMVSSRDRLENNLVKGWYNKSNLSIRSQMIPQKINWQLLSNLMCSWRNLLVLRLKINNNQQKISL